MSVELVTFYFLGGVTLLSALSVLFFANPIYCALALAVTMTGAAALYFSLGAYFIAGVQLTVYAGAVMVMFVMVVMLIDLKKENDPFAHGAVSTFLKVFGAVLFGGILVAASTLTWVANQAGAQKNLPAIAEGLSSTRELAKLLFSKYLFGFESIGILLLVVLIGAIALARARGGTHA